MPSVTGEPPSTEGSTPLSRPPAQRALGTWRGNRSRIVPLLRAIVPCFVRGCKPARAGEGVPPRVQAFPVKT